MPLITDTTHGVFVVSVTPFHTDGAIYWDSTDRVTEFLVLPRFSSGLFRAMFAMKETRNGNEIQRRVSL